MTTLGEKQGWFADCACLALMISLALAIGLPRFRVGIDWQDEGFLAYGAVRVMDGQIPNRDFVSLQPPLCFYLVAVVFKLFGTSLGSLRILGLSIHVLIPVLIYFISRNFLNYSFSLAAALPAAIIGMPYFGFVPLAVWQGITASLIAIALHVPAALKNRRWLAVCSGIVTALSVFLRQDQGVYLIVSIATLTVALRFAADSQIERSQLGRIFATWLAGLGAVTTLFLFVWCREKALPEMFRQLIAFPIMSYPKTSSRPFPLFNVGQPLAQTALTSLYYLPPILVGIAGAWVVRQIFRQRFRRQEAFLIFLVVWSALFYCQVLVRTDPVHLFITLPPFFILIACSGSIFLAQLGPRQLPKICASVVVLLLAIGFLGVIRPIILPDVRKMNEVLELSRGGVRIENGVFLTDFVRRMQSYVPRDRSILALPYEPMFYFLCERRNPTRWNYLWRGDQTPADQEAFVREAKMDPPAVVLVNNEQQVTYIPAILDYVHAECRSEPGVSSLSIYIPNPARP